MIRALVVFLFLTMAGLAAGWWVHGVRLEAVRAKAERAVDWTGEASLAWMAALTAGFLARERARTGEAWSSATWAYVFKHAAAAGAAGVAVAIAWPTAGGLPWAALAWAVFAVASGGYVANLPARI